MGKIVAVQRSVANTKYENLEREQNKEVMLVREKLPYGEINV